MGDHYNDDGNYVFSKEIKKDDNNKCRFTTEVKVSSDQSSAEICENILATQNIPENIKRVLRIALINFIQNKSVEFIEKTFCSNIPQELGSISELTKKWDEPISFKSSVVPSASNPSLDDKELFSTIYHKLVHSTALETILNVEHSYALIMRDIIKQRDEHLTRLSSKQTEEMSKAVEALSLGLTEADITAIATRHLDEHGLETASWQSKISQIQETQRAEYRQWLMSLVEHNCDTPIATPLTSPVIINRTFAIESQVPLLQESFTIHLGSQMKHMYNIRLMAADVLDFCKLRTNISGDMEPQPQRLQTALGLYSNDLCGLVLLSDNHLGGFSGITKDLIKVCEMLPELHFSSIEDQLEEIRNSVRQGVDWRRHNQTEENNLLTATEQQSRKSGTKYLQAGDVYITRHSNLSEVHVVFHMVLDDTVRSNDITSRHSGILGLRNVIKCACSNDVTTLTIPLLLTHESFQGMTIAWCIKRAELVYKCVKGFMIEMSSWGGSELKNLQFLVPKGITEEIFMAIANMIPNIFRISNPLVLESGNSNRLQNKK